MSLSTNSLSIKDKWEKNLPKFHSSFPSQSTQEYLIICHALHRLMNKFLVVYKVPAAGETLVLILVGRVPASFQELGFRVRVRNFGLVALLEHTF